MIEPRIQETPETVASHYNDLDPFYREIWGLHVHHGYWQTGEESSEEATIALIEHLFQGLNLNAKSQICDIGCGYGETSRYLAKKYGSDVTGLSVSREQLEIAKSLGENPSVHLLHRDWMKNDLPSDFFDLAFSIESSEHMPDLRKFFQEAYRVLRPGGSLRICAWLSKKNPNDWEMKHLLKPICEEGRLRLCSVSEYKQLMSETGFSDYHYEDITDQVKKTWTLCIQRCALKFLTDPKYLRFFLKGSSSNKKFLLSLLRIRAAYESKSMTYGIFKVVKP